MWFNWFVLVPISIGNVITIAVLVKIMQLIGLAPRNLIGADFGAMLPLTVVLLLANAAMGLLFVGWLRTKGQTARIAAETRASTVRAAVGD